jgi:plastocyanin
MSGAGGAAPMCLGSVTSPQTANNGDHIHILTLTTTQINVVPGNTVHSVSNVGHSHTVTLTAADRAMLRAGMTVVKTSSNNGHSHGYTIDCTGS